VVVILSSIIYTITFKNETLVSEDTLHKNETNIISLWVILVILILSIIIVSCVVIINYKVKPLAVVENKNAHLVVVVVVGILALASTGQSWDYFGRNSSVNSRNVMAVLTILTAMVLISLKFVGNECDKLEST
jgi:glucan phosphoethanolaminetransferase (alkaline phosphatase superfamily)